MRNILIGTWVGGADDGSGLRTMMYNLGLVFNEDGTGESFSWSRRGQEISEHVYPIEWRLLERNKIEIRDASGDPESGDWTLLEFEISHFVGAYNSKHFKIVEKGKETFFDSPEPLYKSKQAAPVRGLLERIWLKLTKLLFR